MTPYSEFKEWLAYMRINPFGEERADLRAGIVASTIANVNRGKGQRAFNPSDFMPDFDRTPKRQTLAQQKAVFKMFAQAHNAALKNKRNP